MTEKNQNYQKKAFIELPKKTIDGLLSEFTNHFARTLLATNILDDYEEGNLVVEQKALKDLAELSVQYLETGFYSNSLKMKEGHIKRAEEIALKYGLPQERISQVPTNIDKNIKKYEEAERKFNDFCKILEEEKEKTTQSLKEQDFTLEAALEYEREGDYARAIELYTVLPSKEFEKDPEFREKFKGPFEEIEKPDTPECWLGLRTFQLKEYAKKYNQNMLNFMKKRAITRIELFSQIWPIMVGHNCTELSTFLNYGEFEKGLYHSEPFRTALCIIAGNENPESVRNKAQLLSNIHKAFFRTYGVTTEWAKEFLTEYQNKVEDIKL